MSGSQVRGARRARGLRQRDLAKRLGVSQGYVSLLEANKRPVSRRLAARLVRALGLPATALPVRSCAPLAAARAPHVLAALGHEGFGYLGSGRQLNPAEVLLRVLRVDTVDARVVEALVWMLVRYPHVNWNWLVRVAKQEDLQNRVGFLVAVAAGVAEMRGNVPAARVLRRWERTLERSRLQRVDSLSGGLTSAERRWLQAHGSAEARRWNVLSTLSPETFSDASQTPA